LNSDISIKVPAAGETRCVGRSVNEREITLSTYGSGKLPVLLLGGVHGDETEGFLLVERFQQALISGEIVLSPDLTLYVCPRLNPDGCEALRRTNGNNVDLNRNLPTADWTGEFTNVRYFPGRTAGSEPESQLTLSLIAALQPRVIFSMHSYENAMINFNGPCEDLARAMSAGNGLPPKGDIGYPTPGSLGTYAGWERKIPTITLEILRGQDPESVWQIHRTALVTGIEYYLTH
jgi:protein MpaA